MLHSSWLYPKSKLLASLIGSTLLKKWSVACKSEGHELVKLCLLFQKFLDSLKLVLFLYRVGVCREFEVNVFRDYVEVKFLMVAEVSRTFIALTLVLWVAQSVMALVIFSAVALYLSCKSDYWLEFAVFFLESKFQNWLNSFRHSEW